METDRQYDVTPAKELGADDYGMGSNIIAFFKAGIQHEPLNCSELSLTI